MNPYQPLARPRRPGTVTAAMVFAVLVMAAFAVADLLARGGTPTGTGPITDRHELKALGALAAGLSAGYLVFLFLATAGLRAGRRSSRTAALVVVPLLSALKAPVVGLVLASQTATVPGTVTGIVVAALAVPAAALTVFLLLRPASAAYFAGPPR